MKYDKIPKIGREVECVVCGKRKAPFGRSVPAATSASYCNDWPGSECEGYHKDPQPDTLFPGETDDS